jgi:hypothetical protein
MVILPRLTFTGKLSSMALKDPPAAALMSKFESTVVPLMVKLKMQLPERRDGFRNSCENI